jgi:hypothetical protein
MSSELPSTGGTSISSQVHGRSIIAHASTRAEYDLNNTHTPQQQSRLFLEFSLKTLEKDVDEGPSADADVEMHQAGDEEGHERKFTLFPHLPIELRLQIWKYALPEPRILLLDGYSSLVGPNEVRDRPGVLHAESNPTEKQITPFLGLRGACHESCEVFMEHYQHLNVSAPQRTNTYDENVDFAEMDIEALLYRYVDFKADTLLFENIMSLTEHTYLDEVGFLTSNEFEEYGLWIECSKFRNLAVKYTLDDRDDDSDPDYLWEDLQKICPLLKPLNYVQYDGNNSVKVIKGGYSLSTW